jgi:hypothetical protein
MKTLPSGPEPRPTVWVVLCRFDYEGDSVECIFSNEAAAMEYREQRQQEDKWYQYLVEEWEVK